MIYYIIDLMAIYININIPCFGFSSIDYIFQRWYAEIKSSMNEMIRNQSIFIGPYSQASKIDPTKNVLALVSYLELFS